MIGLGMSRPFASGMSGAVLLGIGTAMVYPALLAAAADVSLPASRATTLGWYRLWRDLGYPAGALLAGAVSGAFGLVWAIYLAGLLTFVSGVVASWSLANFLWATFTRANPAADIYGVGAFFEQKHWGCTGPLVIDARLKPHHAPPLAVDPQTAKRVDALAARGGPLAKWL